jgi:hypothetical protein
LLHMTLTWSQWNAWCLFSSPMHVN